MMITENCISRIVVFVGFLLIVLFYCGCGGDFLQLRQKPCDEKIKVVVVTGGHKFEQEPFLEIFQGYDDIKYVHSQQAGHSEIFEDISGWDYDVIVLYSMRQEISPKRRRNFIKLLEKGVGVVSLHHNIADFPDWPQYRKIIGGKYYLKETKEGSVVYRKGKYKHDVTFMVNVVDKNHPITEGVSDFEIYDETYKDHVFEKDNQVLLTTDNPGNERPLCWVRRYAKAKICYLQLGHGPEAYSNENYRRLVAQAIRWSANKLEK